MQNNRVCFVEIETIENGKKELKRLDVLAIKGKVSRQAGNATATAKISIANLTQSDLTYLTTYTSPYVKPKTTKIINVYAGYQNTGWGKIFSGDIITAIPDGKPDTWLNIDAKSLYYQNRIPLSYGVSNITTQELGKSISETLGLDFDWQATSKKTIDLFHFTGSKAQLIKEFNKLDNIQMYEDNGKLKVVDNIVKRPQNTAKIISKDTGMIGVPEPDQFGVKVKTLLDPSLFCGDWFKLQSLVLPGLNGLYWIYSLDFSFSSRETEFYSEIYGKAQGVA